MEMVGNQGILGRGQEGHGIDASSELRGMGIEMKGEITKGDCQGGDERMEHLLMMWGSRGSRARTDGE